MKAYTGIILIFIIHFSIVAQRIDKLSMYPVDSLLNWMTVEEKVQQLSGRSFDTEENKKYQIIGFHMTDGPIGIGQTKRNGIATAFPASVALAATWDTNYAYLMGKAIALEAKHKGKNFLLAPCINIQRFPMGGRNFEMFSEDPFLTSKITVNYIKGVQNEGIIACAKHFVCNNQERNRINLNVKVSERALREIYFPAFKAAVNEGGVKCVMTSYNKVNGVYAGENRWLINDILKDEWGFEGIVLSDWESIYCTRSAAHSGLDVEMPWAKHFGDSLVNYIYSDEIPLNVIDAKVKRVLGVKSWLLKHSNQPNSDTIIDYIQTNRKLALDIARAGIVLLKNEDKTLPINKSKDMRIALIGPNAMQAQIPQKGSVRVTPPHTTSPYEGIVKVLGDSSMLAFATGVRLLDAPYVDNNVHFFTDKKEVGFTGEYFSNKELNGSPVIIRNDSSLNFNWKNASPSKQIDQNDFSVKWKTTLKVDHSGNYSFDVMSSGGYRLNLDGEEVIDQWFVWKPTDIQSYTISLKKNQEYKLEIDYFESEWEAGIKLGVRYLDENKYINEAVRIASHSDKAIVFAGLSDNYEQEGNDRFDFNLPFEQVKLIQSVAAVNKNTIVVINAGTAVDLTDFIDDVSAIIYCWYAGMETGKAIADILFGNYNPSGKLPFTYPRFIETLPMVENYLMSDTLADYNEGIYVGYRYYEKKGIQPLFPFGFGLSYTDFAYKNLNVNRIENGFEISFDIRNRGDLAGAEIAQLYVGKVNSAVDRAVKELKGFAKTELKPNEVSHMKLKLHEDAFKYFDEKTKKWVLEPGIYNFFIGSSSIDIRLSDQVLLGH